MITIFNRRELTSTFDIAQQAEIRQTLASHGIDYLVHLVNQSARGGQVRGLRTANCKTLCTIAHPPRMRTASTLAGKSL